MEWNSATILQKYLDHGIVMPVRVICRTEERDWIHTSVEGLYVKLLY
jgi:hypothetical protein